MVQNESHDGKSEIFCFWERKKEENWNDLKMEDYNEW